MSHVKSVERAEYPPKNVVYRLCFRRVYEFSKDIFTFIKNKNNNNAIINFIFLHKNDVFLIFHLYVAII